jgi:hypothetical protein
VNLSLQVLTYQDLGLSSAGGSLFMAHQIIKEALATLNGVGGLADAALNSFGPGAGLSLG